jgi:hypothetical protein
MKMTNYIADFSLFEPPDDTTQTVITNYFNNLMKLHHFLCYVPDFSIWFNRNDLRFECLQKFNERNQNLLKGIDRTKAKFEPKDNIVNKIYNMLYEMLYPGKNKRQKTIYFFDEQFNIRNTRNFIQYNQENDIIKRSLKIINDIKNNFGGNINFFIFVKSQAKDNKFLRLISSFTTVPNTTKIAFKSIADVISMAKNDFSESIRFCYTDHYDYEDITTDENLMDKLYLYFKTLHDVNDYIKKYETNIDRIINTFYENINENITILLCRLLGCFCSDESAGLKINDALMRERIFDESDDVGNAVTLHLKPIVFGRDRGELRIYYKYNFKKYFEIQYIGKHLPTNDEEL